MPEAHYSTATVHMDVTVDFGHGPETFNLLNLLKIENIEEAFREHASMFAIFAAAAEVAETRREVAEHDLQHAEDELTVLTQTVLEREGMTATLTAKVLGNHVRRNDTYRKAEIVLLETRKDERRLKAICRAFEHRRDMLISLGAHERHKEAIEAGMQRIRRTVKERMD